MHTRRTRTRSPKPAHMLPYCLLMLQSVPVHARRILLPDCLLIVYRCARTRWPHPPHWPGEWPLGPCSVQLQELSLPGPGHPFLESPVSIVHLYTLAADPLPSEASGRPTPPCRGRNCPLHIIMPVPEQPSPDSRLPTTHRASDVDECAEKGNDKRFICIVERKTPPLSRTRGPPSPSSRFLVASPW